MNYEVQPAALSVRDASVYLGIGVSSIYKLINTGKLDARKADSKTLIIKDSCDAYLAGLPVIRKAA